MTDVPEFHLAGNSRSDEPIEAGTRAKGSHQPMNTVDLQAFSYQDRQGLLPSLTSAFANCGGWVLERKTLSPNSVEFSFEIQLSGIVELYSSLVSTGVELTSLAHTTLTDLCTCRYHLQRVAQTGRVISLRLSLSFLEDVTLHSLLMTGTGVA
jgi:hypothetical protein